MNVAALCAGYGGLELGLGLTGVDVNLIWYAETDPHASAVMAAHHPHAPNLGDLTAITDPPPVDIVTAGFPCQPVSNAGKRKGIHDERWLIDDVCKIGRRTGAHRLILENVGGLLTANSGDAFSRVLSALAENGFHARWTCVRASDIGAPHQRLRWFCIASKNTAGVGRKIGVGPPAQVPGDRTGPQVRFGRPNGAPSGTTPTDAESAERRDTQPELLGAPVGPTAKPGKRHRTPTADAGRQRTQIPAARQQLAVEMSGSVGTDRSARWGQYADAIHRWEPIVGRPAPNPTDDRRRLNPKFVEWMMGLPNGHVTDIVERRGPALKILGNGVVPQQAAHALTLLEQM